MNILNNDKNKNVLLVDENDREIGIYDKIRAHEEGLLHRAFSLFIFNERGELIIHKRACHKYHSPGLWTNSCCSHPIPGMSIEESIKVRTIEELGIEIEDLSKVGQILYKASFENGLTEYEFDHIYAAKTKAVDIPFNLEEVAEIDQLSTDDIIEDLKKASTGRSYTEWFKIIMENKEIIKKLDIYKLSLQNM